MFLFFQHNDVTVSLEIMNQVLFGFQDNESLIQNFSVFLQQDPFLHETVQFIVTKSKEREGKKEQGGLAKGYELHVKQSSRLHNDQVLSLFSMFERVFHDNESVRTLVTRLKEQLLPLLAQKKCLHDGIKTEGFINSLFAIVLFAGIKTQVSKVFLGPLHIRSPVPSIWASCVQDIINQLVSRKAEFMFNDILYQMIDENDYFEALLLLGALGLAIPFIQFREPNHIKEKEVTLIPIKITEQPKFIPVITGYESKESRMTLLETNVDDVNGEDLGFLFQALLKKGAVDVSLSPLIMKKNRPGWLIRVIVPREKQEIISQELFSLTSTLGIRVLPLERHVSYRSFKTVHVDIQGLKFTVRLKYASKNPFDYKVEYDDLVRIHEVTNLPLRVIRRLIDHEILRGKAHE